MYQYILLFIIFIAIFGLRVYSSYTKYDRRRNRYVNPRGLALDIVKQNDDAIKFFLDSIKNVDELNTLVSKVIDQIKDEWVKIKQGKSTDSSLILDRYRQIAILEEVMLLQYEMNKKQTDENEFTNKMNVLEEFVEKNHEVLTSIKDEIRAKKCFSEKDCNTLDRYYQDIFNFFQKNKKDK